MDATAEAASDRALVLAASRTLFLGFADGAQNIVVCDDPAPAQSASRLRFLLVDSESGESSPVFGITLHAGRL